MTLDLDAIKKLVSAATPGEMKPGDGSYEDDTDDDGCGSRCKRSSTIGRGMEDRGERHFK